MKSIEFGQCLTLGDSVLRSRKFLRLRQELRRAWDEEWPLDDGQKRPLMPKAMAAAALQTAINWMIAEPREMTKRKAADQIDKAAEIPFFAWSMFRAGFIEERETHFKVDLKDFVLVPGEPNEFTSKEGGK